MPPAELLRISQTDDALRSDPACTQLLLEASAYQTLPFLQPALQSARTRIRSDSAHVVTLGGVARQQLVVGRRLLLHDDEAGGWRALRPMEEARYQHGAALLGGFLFVAGGQSEYDTKGRTATDGAGRNASGEIGTVECYDLSKNEWKFVCPMAESLYGHAGTTHEELMYISGGITRDTFRKELYCYDPVMDTWSRRADMATARGLHCMCTVAGRLYVMGGNHFLGDGSYADVLSVEFYCPATGQWTAAAPMPLGQSDVGVATLRGQVYVLGGYSWSSCCMVDMVQRYDPESDAWEHAFSLPEPMGGIRAFGMTVHTPDDLLESPESHTHEYLLDTPTS
ncbi:hypothetical protein AAFF_G00308250 [Aldrovandia affinis]|uniref:Uncharacterized protein n=1 Tax=Aldrovandia affinis TaxID=143900 RepID=A0AAD7SPU9_9TELE|nr:hypothetical protein AAFF_G00308250 [Aldrovandia affinis]